MVLVPELLYNVCQSASTADSDCSSSCTIYNVVTAVNIYGLLSGGEGSGNGVYVGSVYYMLPAYLYIYSYGIGSRASL